MSMDELYERVTEAILHAEHMEVQGATVEMRKAFLDVSRIEEEIAKATPASGPEGAVARRGAVRAALKSDDPLYANSLADRYLDEPVPSALADELRRMKADAEARLDDSAARRRIQKLFGRTPRSQPYESSRRRATTSTTLRPDPRR